MQPTAVANWNDLADREPAGALVGNVDLVIVRCDEASRCSTAAACIVARCSPTARSTGRT